MLHFTLRQEYIKSLYSLSQCGVLWEISDLSYLFGAFKEVTIVLEAQGLLKTQNHAR